MTQHTHSTAEGAVFVVGDDDNNQAYLGCFGTRAGEPAEVTEARWNRFAKTLWEWGIEPIEDEPTYTIIEEGVTYDHYILRPVDSVVITRLRQFTYRLRG